MQPHWYILVYTVFIFKVVAALKNAKVNYAIVGGFAVALHGAVRGTVDVDLVIGLTKPDYLATEEALKNLGLEPRLPVRAEQIFDFHEEYRKNKNLVAWSFYNPQNPSEIVDIIITHDLKKMKTKKISAGKITLNLLSIDSLISMKKESGRPQDLEDIKALQKLKI